MRCGRGLGAYDFFAKPFEPELLGLTIERAFRLAELQAENRACRRCSPGCAGRPDHARPGDAAQVCRTIEKVAGQQCHRDAAGRKRHRQGGAGAGPAPGLASASGKFVAINCAAIPENLLESELFGYEKGAFTGAAKTTPGKIETANGGTLMLDEIGDLPHRCRPSCCASCRSARSSASAGAGDPGGRARGLRHAPGPAGLIKRAALSAKTCTTGWPRSWSTSRRCASARAMPCCWRMPSCAALRRSSGADHGRCRPHHRR
jgi:hypothetical protein